MITDVSEIAQFAGNFFTNRDSALKQATRAQGGEPCIECGEPIDPKANWKTRDRWLCGKPNCNRRAKARYARELAAGLIRPNSNADEIAALKQEWLRQPQLFKMDLEREFPFEIGRWPKPGDIISRFGQDTAIEDPAENEELAELADFRNATEIAKDFRLAIHLQTGATVSYLCDPLGRIERVWPPFFVLDGDRFQFRHDNPILEIDGQSVWLQFELISDVDNFGNEYRWEAPVFTPAPTPPLWTRPRLELSMQRARISRARSAYLARRRAMGFVQSDAEHIDPESIYERDEWVCGICGNEIDRALKFPDPQSVSLDHIEPVSIGGSHTVDNVRASHLICNIVQGNRGD